MKKFIYTIEVEIPSDRTKDYVHDEYLLSALELHPIVTSNVFEDLKIITLDIKREDGSSLGGFPSRYTKEYTFVKDAKLEHSLHMVDKSRKQ